MPAEKCKLIVNTKLRDFNIDLEKNVVCMTTDGSSVMVKVGSLVSNYQQLCFAHGIQLAVIDVLYTKDKFPNHRENDDTEADKSDSDKFGSEDELEGNDTGESDVDEEIPIDFDICNGAKCIVTKIRKIVKIFRNSIILDRKTRWNSLVNMIKQFVELKPYIQKSLIDIKSKITVSDHEFEQASTLLSTLHPIKITVEALCRRDANLLTCDTALKFMLNKLENIDSSLAKELLNPLNICIRQRRTDISGVLQYLHNVKDAFINDSLLYSVPTRSFMKNFIVDSWTSFELEVTDSGVQTFAATSNTLSSENILLDENIILLEETQTLQQENLEDELQRSIKDSLVSIENRIISNDNRSSLKLITVVGREMKIFEESGNRGPHLQRVYKDLLTIPPTSVESERVFSAVGTTI